MLLGSKACFDIAETVPIGQLSKGHAEVLVETGKTFYLIVAAIAIDASAECMQRQIVHDLRKNHFAGVHYPAPHELLQKSAGNSNKISNR